MVSTGKMLAFINALGGNSGPSEVVILPETVLETIEGTFVGATPLSNLPTDGATAVITYNGVEYTSPIIYVAQNAMFAMGNTEALGIQGGNADAPFMVALSPSGYDGQYVSVMPLDDATSVTISIVQVGAASGGGGGASAMIVNIDPSTMTIDKPFSDVHAAVSTGEIVHFLLKDSGKVLWLYPSECMANEIVAFSIYFSGGILQARGLKISSDGKAAQIGS